MKEFKTPNTMEFDKSFDNLLAIRHSSQFITYGYIDQWIVICLLATHNFPVLLKGPHFLLPCIQRGYFLRGETFVNFWKNGISRFLYFHVAKYTVLFIFVTTVAPGPAILDIMMLKTNPDYTVTLLTRATQAEG